MRMLLVDNESIEFKIFMRKHPQIDWHWLPAVTFAISYLKIRTDFDLVLLDVSGTSVVEPWKDEVSRLQEIYFGEILAISSVFNPTASDIPFMRKDNIHAHIDKLYEEKYQSGKHEFFV